MPNHSGKQAISQMRGEKNDAVGDRNGIDRGVRQVIAEWRTLPRSLRRAIVTIVEAHTKLIKANSSTSDE